MLCKTRLDYYCSDCRNRLYDIVAKGCPHCGSLLLGPSIQKIENNVIFQNASKVPRLTTDIVKMDSILHFLSLNQKIAVVGYNSQKLIERLVVRAQLPHRHGGLETHVILVDGGNSSDPYLCINFARQYGLDVHDILSKIISSRAFTIYQLENIITHELQTIIKQYNAKFVVISDLFGMFVDDPYLDKYDVQRLLISICESISTLQDCIVMVSISQLNKHCNAVMKFFDRIIRLSNKNNFVKIEIDHNNSFVIKINEMENISR